MIGLKLYGQMKQWYVYKKISLNKEWINKDENKIRRVVKNKNPLKIHVWGCILKNHKNNNDNLLFQQDNAPCHTSFKMCKFFSENN